MKVGIVLLPLCLSLAGCMSAARHYRQLGTTQDRAMTVGVVKKQIKVGVSQSDVATTLGAPNIVTRDSQNRETWVYDKIATEASFSTDTGNVMASLTGIGNFAGFGAGAAGDSGTVTGNVGGSYTKSAGAASITQRTLTVVIKFGHDDTVESLSYHSTTF